MAKRIRPLTAEAKDAWQDFLTNIDKCSNELIGGSEDAWIWYRGESSRDHDLLPSLFRGYKDPNGRHWDAIWQREQDLYWEFSARARELHGAQMTDWDILFAMQHYGTPTRLLDWTEVLGVAVYFAILKWWNGKPTDDVQASKVPCVWLLEPYMLNMEYYETNDPEASDLLYPPNLGYNAMQEDGWDYGDLLTLDGIGWDETVAIYPRQQNDRIQSQSGWFTIHGQQHIPINKNKRHKEFLRRVDLPIEAIPAARRFLDQAGFNHYSLFPDLANLSKHLVEKFPAKG